MDTTESCFKPKFESVAKSAMPRLQLDESSLENYEEIKVPFGLTTERRPEEKLLTSLEKFTRKMNPSQSTINL